MPDPTLRAVPDAPPRVLGLIRVSKERDGMVSPEVQRISIEDYSRARGYVIEGWLEGLDESGSSTRSAWWPRLEQAVGDIEAGRYDVIVVWKFSRTARQRLKWATAVDRVEQAGGRIESATEQVDVTTSTGRFTRGMLAELNAFEAERIGEVWREVHERRVREGRPATGTPKFGYTYDQAAKLHVPDPTTGPALAEAYRRYVAGESHHSLVRWFNSLGLVTTRGKPWTAVTLRRTMDAGFAIGRFRRNGALVDGVHEPLIDADLWQAYLDRRTTRRSLMPQGERSEYLASRMLRCGRCGGPMVGGARAGKDRPAYKCARSRAGSAQTCRGALVDVRQVDRFIVGWLTDLAGEVDDAAAAQAEADARRATLTVDRDRLARQLVRTEEALTRLVVQHATTPSSPEVYAAAHAELTGQMDRLKAEIGEAERHRRRIDLDPPAVAAGLLAGWHTTSIPVRREVLRRLVDHIVVHPGLDRVNGRLVSATTFDVTTTWVTN